MKHARSHHSLNTAWPRFVALALLLAASACGADDGDGDRFTHGPGTIGESDGPLQCSVNHLRGPDAAFTGYLCTEDVANGTWRCDCDGDEGAIPMSDVDDCTAALAAVCDVPTAPNWCDEGDIGMCWPNLEETAFNCRCGDDATILVDAPACRSALFDACATSCEVAGQGSCEPLDDVERFDCSCEDGRAAVIPNGASCAYALRHMCEPTCQSTTGACYMSPEVTGFDCRCTGETSFTRHAFSELGHDDPCATLATQCGSPADESTRCERTSADGTATGSCRIDPTGTYTCQCESATGSSVNVGSGDDGTCEGQLLAAFCPAAFE